MRLMPISMCKPGMRLGKKLYNEEGLVLLSEHVELTGMMLRRLQHHGIDFLYIDDPRTDDIVIPELLSDETRLAATKVIRSHFSKMMDDSGKKMAVNAGNISKDFKNILNLMIDDLSRNKDAMIMLTSMQITDHYLFQHSMNVCIYSTLLGISEGYNREELTTIGLGALLHDIGKTKVDLQALKKPGRLTDEEFTEIKRHAMLGFQLLKDEPNIPLLSAHCALQHHERLDGSGYPRGIKGEEIHEYARWIGLVDAYDAMTTHRVYRTAMLPHQVMEILYTEAGTKFETRKVERFRDKIAIYPLGITVTLDSGESGVIVDLNANVPHRPVVRILTDETGNDLEVPYEVDLSKKLHVMIHSVNQFKHESA
ncbi:HD-GYP domain-containing protein [Gorillibacterium sp. sgz5001074]|uniref:HD-GYP domain-containing protein n=1 Tax=Gorillibacterium sp. sgz5001074 TaxID=3446695 RepID=UPI003F66A91F